MSEIYEMWDTIVSYESSGDYKAASRLYKELNKRMRKY